ncbi:GDSL-type esterase/lipase family protein [Amycolatopsis saalfeldensis]|uniref:Lysophospholipase L1 n=1 Tax=Amycolatopsis saalfeldensis TaxID=394193 RepID=A0A1H8XEM9_9PSEU|nr:GDSL-type esterase/lipase family protein [Amycolatopsis saalfeldensis]SEP38400.1 Lysophospholipase L1 [Amycolatopsis saalfeldensis]
MLGRLSGPLLRRRAKTPPDRFGGSPLPAEHVVFLGDSITEAGSWNEWFPRYPVLNRGISGDTLEGVRARLATAINRPAAISLLIGTNDLNGQGRTPEVAGIAAQFADLVAELRALAPDAPLIVNSVMPRTRRWASRIHELNRRYAEIAGDSYLDLWPALADGKALRKSCTGDGLHLNGNGYRAWLEVLRPRLEAVL